MESLRTLRDYFAGSNFSSSSRDLYVPSCPVRYAGGTL